jgi:hypothetical protein
MIYCTRQLKLTAIKNSYKIKVYEFELPFTLVNGFKQDTMILGF